MDKGEPKVSRPPHKNVKSQKSGKGKVDYIFVKTSSKLSMALERDEISYKTILESHKPCKETG